MGEAVSEQHSFAARLQTLLTRTSYRVILEPHEREAVYRLRYEANVREGTILANPDGRLYDRFDETPNALNIGMFVDGELTAALRLHVLSAAHPISPALDAYPDLVAPLLAKGATLIDTSRLAANFTRARRIPQLPYVVLRAAIMAAEHFGTGYITGACRAEHFPFYAREYMGVRACPPRPYPTLVKPLCLVLIDFAENRQAILERRPFYASMTNERAALFRPALAPA